LALGLHAWLRRFGEPADPAALALGTPAVVGLWHALLPPALMAFLLFHPRSAGLWKWRRGQDARKALGLRFATPADADPLRRSQARQFIGARVGPLWARCGVAGILLGGWCYSLGWLAVEPSPRHAASLWPFRRPDIALVVCVAVGAAAFFASHVCHWERASLTARRTSRLEVFGAFWRGAGWTALSQASAAVFSLGFGLLLLLLAGVLSIAYSATSHLSTPGWTRYVLDGARPRPELLLLALPGMVGQAIQDALSLRRDLEARLSMLALEVARERGLLEKAGTRRRVAGGGADARLASPIA